MLGKVYILPDQGLSRDISIARNKLNSIKISKLSLACHNKCTKACLATYNGKCCSSPTNQGYTSGEAIPANKAGFPQGTPIAHHAGSALPARFNTLPLHTPASQRQRQRYNMLITTSSQGNPMFLGLRTREPGPRIRVPSTCCGTERAINISDDHAHNQRKLEAQILGAINISDDHARKQRKPEAQILGGGVSDPPRP